MDGIQLALTEAERLLQETTKKKEENEAMARRLCEEEEIAQLAKENLQQVCVRQLFVVIFLTSLTYSLSLSVVIANGRCHASSTDQRRSSSSR